MTILLISRPDGGVNIDYPADGFSYRLCTKKELPEDTYFRNAWFDNGESIEIRMDIARKIHMRNIRISRDREFIEMGFRDKPHKDIEANMLSQETRDLLQQLRDLPENTDLSKAETPEALKAIWPEILTVRE